jgi:hypothetical protein
MSGWWLLALMRWLRRRETKREFGWVGSGHGDLAGVALCAVDGADDLRPLAKRFKIEIVVDVPPQSRIA